MQENLPNSIDEVKFMFFALSSMITIITSGVGILHYKIYKDFNKNTELKILEPEKIKAKLKYSDEKRLLSQSLGKDILKFKKVLSKNIDKENLNILYNNLKTIHSKEKNFYLRYLRLQFIGGNYIPKKNKITVLKAIKQKVLSHELLHMSSTIYNKKKKRIFVGFHQINSKTTIGRALNEGYTEVLVERYFKQNDILSHSYMICKFFAKKLEEIIGKDTMQSAYFNANLPQLINELKKYDDEHNIIDFIRSLDLILKYIYEIYPKTITTTKLYVKRKIKEPLKNVQETLIKWYIKKRKEDLKNNLITEEEFIKDISEYFLSIKNNKLLLNKNINTIDYESIRDFLEIEDLVSIKKILKI